VIAAVELPLAVSPPSSTTRSPPSGADAASCRALGSVPTAVAVTDSGVASRAAGGIAWEALLPERAGVEAPHPVDASVPLAAMIATARAKPAGIRLSLLTRGHARRAR
jgi:hypothetical protein